MVLNKYHQFLIKKFVKTNVVCTFVKKFDMRNKPKCGCGNTQSPDGYCDGSHNKEKN